jgi:hypothetical protein
MMSSPPACSKPALSVRTCAFCSQPAQLSDPSDYCIRCSVSRQRIARRYFARQSKRVIVGHYLLQIPRR